MGPTGYFAGYFRPPVSSDYTFVSVADDNAMVWMNLDRANASKMELIIDFVEWLPLPQRDWYRTQLRPSGPCPSHTRCYLPVSLSRLERTVAETHHDLNSCSPLSRCQSSCAAGSSCMNYQP